MCARVYKPAIQFNVAALKLGIMFCRAIVTKSHTQNFALTSMIFVNVFVYDNYRLYICAIVLSHLLFSQTSFHSYTVLLCLVIMRY